MNNLNTLETEQERQQEQEQEQEFDSELELDLNAEHYTLDEIREMLHLDEYKLSDLDYYIVDTSYDLIYEKIKKEYSGHTKSRDSLLQFYNQLKTKLFAYIRKNKEHRVNPKQYEENDEQNAYCIRNDSLNKTDVPVITDTNQFRHMDTHIQQYVMKQVKTLFKKNQTTRSTLLVINSKFRKNILDTASDFTIDLPYRFNNVVSLSLRSIEFTNTMYTINEKSSFFYLNGEKKMIDVGNYTHNELINRINSTVEDLDLTHDLYKNKTTFRFIQRNGTEYTLNPDDPDNQLEQVIKPDTMTINFDNGYPFYTTLGYILGFRNKEYILTATDTNITSEAVLDSEGTRNIYIEVDDFLNASATTNMVVLTDKNYMSNNVLAKIQNYAATYHVAYDCVSDTPDKLRVYNGPVTLNRFHIRILDDNGELVDNNMMDYIITLEINILI